jgi:hypothetical protein
VPLKSSLAPLCHPLKLLLPSRHSVRVASTFYRLGVLTCGTGQIKCPSYPLSWAQPVIAFPTFFPSICFFLLYPATSCARLCPSTSSDLPCARAPGSSSLARAHDALGQAPPRLRARGDREQAPPRAPLTMSVASSMVAYSRCQRHSAQEGRAHRHLLLCPTTATHASHPHRERMQI